MTVNHDTFGITQVIDLPTTTDNPTQPTIQELIDQVQLFTQAMLTLDIAPLRSIKEV